MNTQLLERPVEVVTPPSSGSDHPIPRRNRRWLAAVGAVVLVGASIFVAANTSDGGGQAETQSAAPVDASPSAGALPAHLANFALQANRSPVAAVAPHNLPHHRVEPSRVAQVTEVSTSGFDSSAGITNDDVANDDVANRGGVSGVSFMPR